MRHDDVAVAAPAKGWKLIARRRITADRIYNTGCEVPVAALGKNFASMLAGHYVEWVPPNVPITAKPLPLPPPTPPAPKPPVEIVSHPDVVERWFRTLALMTERVGGSKQRAQDILFTSAEMRALYVVAVRAHCARTAARLGRWSISPTEAGI